MPDNVAAGMAIAGELLVTETTNEARLEVARLSPSRRVAISSLLDRRTCPLCQTLDGKVMWADSPEAARYQPPFHINCRCLLVEVGDDEAGDVDELDQADPELAGLVAKHGHFVRDPERYAPLRIPAGPSRRDFVVRRFRDESGEWVTELRWQRPRYELDLPPHPDTGRVPVQTGVMERGPRWQRLGEGDGGPDDGFLPPLPGGGRGGPVGPVGQVATPGGTAVAPGRAETPDALPQGAWAEREPAGGTEEEVAAAEARAASLFRVVSYRDDVVVGDLVTDAAMLARSREVPLPDEVYVRADLAEHRKEQQRLRSGEAEEWTAQTYRYPDGAVVVLFDPRDGDFEDPVASAAMWKSVNAWSSDDPRHAVLHEFGQAAHRSAYSGNYDELRRALTEEERLVAEGVSRQAMIGPREFVGEVFVRLMLNLPVAPDALEMYNRFGGVVPK